MYLEFVAYIPTAEGVFLNSMCVLHFPLKRQPNMNEGFFEGTSALFLH